MHTPSAPDESTGAATAVAGPTTPRRGEEQTPQSPGPSGRKQRPRLRRRPTGADLLAAGVFALAGAMFVAGAVASGGEDLRPDRTGGLREAIVALSEQNVELSEEVDSLTAQVAELQATTGAGSALQESRDAIAELEPQVGLTEVRGPGVTVTLTDAPIPPQMPEGFTGDDYLVHQEDVLGVVNALWRGGASGMTVMGHRVISTTAVRCVGNTIIMQGHVYSPPFEIAAVGDVARMEVALEADPAVSFFRDWSEVVGLGYTQVPAEELVLPAYTGPISPKYAAVTS